MTALPIIQYTHRGVTLVTLLPIIAVCTRIRRYMGDVSQASRLGAQSFDPAAAVPALAAKPTAFERLDKALAGTGVLAGCLGPFFP